MWWLRNVLGDSRMSLCRRKAGQMLYSSGNSPLAMFSNFTRSLGDTQYHTYKSVQMRILRGNMLECGA